jgi:hypothetical protein
MFLRRYEYKIGVRICRSGIKNTVKWKKYIATAAFEKIIEVINATLTESCWWAKYLQ